MEKDWEWKRSSKKFRDLDQLSDEEEIVYKKRPKTKKKRKNKDSDDDSDEQWSLR